MKTKFFRTVVRFTLTFVVVLSFSLCIQHTQTTYGQSVQQEEFKLSAIYPVEPDQNKLIFYIEMVDVNKDGHLDIAIPYGESSDSFAIYKNHGDGTFQYDNSYSTGNAPYAIAFGDFNLDGYPDTVLVDHYSAEISVLLNNGDGTFAEQHKYSVNGYPDCVAVADFNNDGYPDIVVGHEDSQDVMILFNDKNGGFSSPIDYPMGDQIFSLAAADLNGDGYVDLAIAKAYQDSVDVYLNDGMGNFTYSSTNQVGNPSAGGYGVYVYVKDVNGDHFPDIVATDAGASTVAVFINKNNGSYFSASVYPVPATPDRVDVADLNGDGFPDIVVNAYYGYTISVLYNLGDGTFSNPQSIDTGQDYASGLKIGDVNGDGKSDIVFGDTMAYVFKVFLNNGPIPALDVTAPTTTIFLDNSTPTGQNGWYTSPVHVTVSATDDPNGTGVAETRCVLDPTMIPVSFDDIPIGCSYTNGGMDIDQDGQHTLYSASIDNAGNKESPIVSQTINVDIIGPILNPLITPNLILLHASATITPGATDTVSGIAVQSCGALDTNTVGPKTVICTATDNAGNPTSKTVSYSVSYRFDGFLQPINDTAHQSCPGCPTSIFKGNSTVPVKFQLKDANGNVVQGGSLPLWITPQQGGHTSDPVDENTYSDPATTGNTYTLDGDHYSFNWKTKGYATGFYWRIGVKLDDGHTYYVYIGLR
jgi:hypothetical protein